MDQASYANHLLILREELVLALGCTEPIAVALAAALARSVLGVEPERLEVACSGSIIKNVKSVTVPNSGGLRGIEAAAILGAVGGDATASLEVLQGVTPQELRRTRELLDQPGYCSVTLEEGVPNLYVRVVARAAGHEAVARIEERHTNVTELSLDGGATREEAASRTPVGCEDLPVSSAAGRAERGALSLASIWEFAHDTSLADVDELISGQLSCNDKISRAGLSGSWGSNIGSTLLASRSNDVCCRARAAAAAGSDARMSGCPLPVTIVCGSGNQGITCSAPVLEYARELGASHEALVRAVVLSDLTAVHVKYYIGELSAFCGAVCAACGAGAGIAYLRGCTFDQYGATVVNTLANVGGIVCDGAKPSCAAKVSAAVDAAVLAGDMAFADKSFKAGDGLVGADAERTIRTMGRVGRVGMRPTDVEILNIMIGKTDV
ncbi:L-cysteine desulfidase family protein [Olsenella massiliensis]|uniref:L-cysteine desulfidase family protein n=1 Tax=Olsenella massiliensis TaxID=1622075 RepID=UPI00071D06F9|nr:L-serine ammonia-lyase, iron-sulfur-dependent, subunit alpha [Olsenella massiliensis]